MRPASSAASRWAVRVSRVAVAGRRRQMQHGVGDPPSAPGSPAGRGRIAALRARSARHLEARARAAAAAARRATSPQPTISRRCMHRHCSDMRSQSPSSRAVTTSRSRTTSRSSRPRCARASACPTAARTAPAAPARARCSRASVDHGAHQEKALTDEEKAQGQALFCQATPLTDLVIEARTSARPRTSRCKTAVPRAEAASAWPTT